MLPPPSIQAKCSQSRQAEGFTSKRVENRWETLQENEATGEENGNSYKTKKKAGLPLCSQTLPPPLAHWLPLSCSLPRSSNTPRENHINGVLK